MAQRAATATALASKFVSEDGALSLSFGSQRSFYVGLEGLLGPPSPHAIEAMEREHIGAADSGVEFVTRNYCVTTTSATEWHFVVDPSEAPRKAGPRRVAHRAGAAAGAPAPLPPAAPPLSPPPLPPSRLCGTATLHALTPPPPPLQAQRAAEPLSLIHI